MSLDELIDSMRKINGNSDCNHDEAYHQIGKYFWVCKCKRHKFLKATPELRKQFKEWAKEEDNGF
jgi:hypothetical protein